MSTYTRRNGVNYKVTTIEISDEVRGFWNARGVSMASVMRMSVDWWEELQRCREGIKTRDERLARLMADNERLLEENRDLRGFKARALEQWRVRGVKGHD